MLRHDLIISFDKWFSKFINMDIILGLPLFNIRLIYVLILISLIFLSDLVVLISIQ